MKFSQRIKELRTKNKMTQEDLADLIGVSRTTITGYETRGTEPSLDKLLELSKIFGVACDFLLGNDDYIKSFRMKIPLVETCKENGIYLGLQQSMEYVSIDSKDEVEGVFAYKNPSENNKIYICRPQVLKSGDYGLFYANENTKACHYYSENNLHVLIPEKKSPLIFSSPDDFIYLGHIMEVRKRF